MSHADDAADLDPIIAAVWQVMAESGLAAVSMRTVAAAAGVSVGRIQYRFRTKEELVRASLAAMVSSAEALHRQGTPEAAPREELWRLLALSIPHTEHARVGVAIFYQYVAAATTHPALASLLRSAKEGAEAEAARLLARIAPAAPDARATARSLVAISDGLTLRVQLGGLPAREAEQALRAAVAEAIG